MPPLHHFTVTCNQTFKQDIVGFAVSKNCIVIGVIYLARCINCPLWIVCPVDIQDLELPEREMVG